MPIKVTQSYDAKISLSLSGVWKRRCYVAVVAVLLAVAPAYLISRENYGAMMILGMIFPLGFIMLVLSVVAGSLSWLFTRKWPQDSTRKLLIGISMVSFFYLYFSAATIFDRMGFATAVGYAEKAIPVLEQYRHIHGNYPETLAKVPQLQPLPYGLSYYVYKKEFVFDYPCITTCFPSGYAYSSETHKWTWLD